MTSIIIAHCPSTGDWTWRPATAPLPDGFLPAGYIDAQFGECLPERNTDEKFANAVQEARNALNKQEEPPKVKTVRGAFRDLNSKGKGPETFRKVWRNGSWQWISGTLPRNTFTAAERYAQTEGDVLTGEIVAQFGRNLPDRKCSLEKWYEVADEEKPLKSIKAEKIGLGLYKVTKLDGSTVELPDPIAR